MATEIKKGVKGYKLSKDKKVQYYIPEDALTAKEAKFLKEAVAEVGDGNALEKYLKDNKFKVTGRNAYVQFKGLIKSVTVTTTTKAPAPEPVKEEKKEEKKEEESTENKGLFSSVTDAFKSSE